MTNFVKKNVGSNFFGLHLLRKAQTFITKWVEKILPCAFYQILLQNFQFSKHQAYFAYFPPSAINGDSKRTFDPNYL